MKSFADLQAELQKAFSVIHALEEAIAAHPEQIANHFSRCSWLSFPGVKELVESLDSLHPTSDWTDSRKNPMQWYGYNFSFKNDDQVYTYRSGSNWCSEVLDCGNNKFGFEDIDRNWQMDNTDEETLELTKEALEEIMKHPKHIALGHLLCNIEGW